MANVVVDWMMCVEESDELGDDDVYLMLFRGAIPAAGGLESDTEFSVTGPGSFWDDVSTYDVRRKDVKVSSFDKDSIYVAQLIERDNGRDVTGSVTSAYRTALEVAWTGALARTLNATPAARREKLVATVRETLRGLNTIYMEFPKGNDDWIGSPKELAPKENALVPVGFKGDGARYAFTFKIAS